MNRAGIVALAVGVAGTLCWLGAVAVTTQAALRAFLPAFIFWSGMVLGAAGLTFLGDFLGGNWYGVVQPQLRAIRAMMPWAALAFLPVAAGYQEIFPWAAGRSLPPHLQAYFHPVAFWLRAAAVWGLWIALVAAGANPARQRPVAIAGLCLFFILVTAGAVDWVMSLDAPWHSTTFGLLLGVGFALSAMTWAFGAALLTAPAGGAGPLARNDAANMLLTLSALWAYLGFTQYLIVWAGNLAAETPWFVARTAGGWQWVAVFLMVTGFALPIALMLFRTVKRSRRGGFALLSVIFLSRLADVYWHVAPAYWPGKLHLSWIDAAAFLGLGGLFMWRFLKITERKELPTVETHERGYGI